MSDNPQGPIEIRSAGVEQGTSPSPIPLAVPTDVGGKSPEGDKPSEHSKIAAMEHHHPSFHRGAMMREQNLALAHTVLSRLRFWLIGTVIFFGLAHLLTTMPILEKLPRDSTVRILLTGLRKDSVSPVILDGGGRVISISDLDLRWQVGRDEAAAIRSGLEDRSKRISDLRDQTVDQALLEFRVKLGGGIGATPTLKRLLEEIEICVSSTNNNTAGSNYGSKANNFELASEKFTELIEGWGEETRQRVGEAAIFELNYGLEELATLKREQEEVAANLSPHASSRFFGHHLSAR
jgi:hypothetical protein